MIQTLKQYATGQSWNSFLKQGMGFAVYAVLVNILDELVIPATLAYFGHPALGGIAILGDLDWLTYPLYFIVKSRFF